MRKLDGFLLVCGLLVLPFGRAAYAQDVDYARSGPYVGIGWASALEDFEDEIEDAALGLSVDVDDSVSISGRVGYRFHPRLAVELEYGWYDDFDFDADLAGFGQIAEGNVNAWSLMANLKGYLLTGRVQPYGLVGIGMFDAEYSVNDTVNLGLSVKEDERDLAWQFGGGVDIYPGEGNVLLFLEATYVIPRSDLDDLNLWTLGIGVDYRF